MSRVALLLSLVSGLAATSMLLPAPTWNLWLVHFALLEASLGVTLVGLLAMLLARLGSGGRLARRLALFSVAVGLLPFAAVSRRYLGSSETFSWQEYIRGLEGPRVRVERDIDMDAGGLRADLYRPPGGPASLVVVLHGGSWTRGDKGEAPYVSRALAAAGFVVADLQYRLAPQHLFPDAVADVKCLLGRLRERAAGLGADPSKAALLGRSAGAEIALVAAYSMGDPRIPPSCAVAESSVQAVVSLYGPTDLVWGHDNPVFPDPIDGPAQLEAYLGGPPSARADAYRLGSPLTWADRPLPPTLLIHGASDRLVSAEHLRRLAAGLRAAGRPVETLLVPLADHGFDRRPGGLGEQLARAAILRFLARLRASRRLGLALWLLLGVGISRSAADVVWTALHVEAYLADDGRYHVVETHHMRVEKGGFSLFREFGLGADQAIAFKSLTRVDADGTEHPLVNAEVGEDPNRYRYYDRGHAYYRVPALPEGGELAFRFEYDVVNAVAPVWGIAAGPRPLVESPWLVKPWRRLGDIVADWQEGRHDVSRRYRLEHDVLLPSREGPGYKLLNMDYRLEYETGWKRVRPDVEIATVFPDDHYRVRVLFEVPPGAAPKATSSREAAARLVALAALPVVGVVFWLMLLGVEWATARGLGPVGPELVAEHLMPLAPEELDRLSGGPLCRADAEAVLSRLASERKIAVEVQAQGDDDKPAALLLRRLVPPSSLPAFERAVLEPLFPEGPETTSARLGEVYKDRGLNPTELVAGLLPALALSGSAARWSVVHVLTIPAILFGLYLQFRSVGEIDVVPFLLMANGGALVLARAWPKGWWCTARPARGLLVPLALMCVGYLALQLAFNRPLPAEAWVGGALVILGCHASVLAGSRMRTGGPYTRLRQFARLRRFAAAELRLPSPRLEDAWTTRLEALGLGREIARWRERFGGAGQLAPDISSLGAADVPSGPRYTGRVAEPFAGPAGWTDALYVNVDDDEDAG